VTEREGEREREREEKNKETRNNSHSFSLSKKTKKQLTRGEYAFSNPGAFNSDPRRKSDYQDIAFMQKDMQRVDSSDSSQVRRRREGGCLGGRVFEGKKNSPFFLPFFLFSI